MQQEEVDQIPKRKEQPKDANDPSQSTFPFRNSPAQKQHRKILKCFGAGDRSQAPKNFKILLCTCSKKLFHSEFLLVCLLQGHFRDEIQAISCISGHFDDEIQADCFNRGLFRARNAVNAWVQDFYALKAGSGRSFDTRKN